MIKTRIAYAQTAAHAPAASMRGRAAHAPRRASDGQLNQTTGDANVSSQTFLRFVIVVTYLVWWTVWEFIVVVFVNNKLQYLLK